MALNEVGKDRRYLAERSIRTVSPQSRRRWRRDPPHTWSNGQTSSRRCDTEQPLCLGCAHDLHVRARLLHRWGQQSHCLQTDQVEHSREAVELGHRLLAIAPGILAGD
jgi:hypothetical protein